MPRSIDDIDELIRQALGQADAEALDRLEGQSMAELLTETFRGRHRRLAIGGAIVNLVLFSAGCVSGVRFIRADDQRTMLLWGAAMLLCFGAVTAIKIWYWLEMNRLALTREVKRVELQVVQIALKLGERPAE